MALFNNCIVLFLLLSSIPETYQVPLQKIIEEEQNDNTAGENKSSFGQRLSPRFPSRRLKGRISSSSQSSLLTPSSTLSSLTTQHLNLLTNNDSPLEGRNFYVLEPITVNRTEGSCDFDGRVYQSGDNIERKHLCHFCFCRNGYIDCYWKNCPPAPEGCVELTYEGVCERSLYLCPIPKKTKPTKPELNRSGYKNNTQLGCDILGVKYRVGELVGVATDPCLECRCALDALYCSPKCCFQPAEPDDDVAQQIQRSDGYKPLQHNPLQHLRSDFQPERDE